MASPPVYRYYTCDLLTNEVFSELPLYGVYMDKQLGQAGNFTGTYKLGTGIEDDGILIESTEPQRTAIYVERDGEIIWGGIIWSRTYSSQSDTVQLSAQTFESYVSKVIILSNFVRPNVATSALYEAHAGIPQLSIFKDALTAMQAQEASNIGLDLSLVPVAGKLKKIKVASYEFKYWDDPIGDLADAEDGFDWTIEVVPGATIDQPQKVVRVGEPKLVPGGTDSPITYDFPGSIDEFYWPESGSKSGTRFIGLGAGQGSNVLQAQAVWPGGIGYPAIWQVLQFKDVGSNAILQGRVQDYASRFGSSQSVPTFTLKSDVQPTFEGWNQLGANFTAYLEAPRFPNGKIVESRMIGWELTTADKDSTEKVKLRVDGED